MRYLIRTKTWYPSGGVETSLELSDAKSLEYDKKTYYNNGQLKEEGSLLFSESTKEYVKIGSWTSYDVDGKNKQVQKYPKAP
jgi:antitoxin component YwqK of YwqJK toxin-antitoxin module